MIVGEFFRLLILINGFLLAAPEKALFDRVYVEFGRNLGTLVPQRILQHLLSVEELSVRDVTLLSSLERDLLIQDDSQRLLILALGNSSLSLEIIRSEECSSLEPESFRIVSNLDSRGFIILSSNGRPLDAHTHTNVSFDKDDVHYGAVVGAYASLELLGNYVRYFAALLYLVLLFLFCIFYHPFDHLSQIYSFLFLLLTRSIIITFIFTLTFANPTFFFLFLPSSSTFYFFLKQFFYFICFYTSHLLFLFDFLITSFAPINYLLTYLFIYLLFSFLPRLRFRLLSKYRYNHA